LVCLEGVVVEGLRAVLGLDDDVGLGESALVVTTLVAARVSDEGAALHCFLGVEQRLHHIPLRLDQSQRGECLRHAVGGESGDGLPLVRDVVREPVDLADDEEASHAGSFLRAACVDARQPRVGMRAAEERGVEHPRQSDVRRVARLAARTLVAVDLRCRPPNDVERPRGPLVERVLLDDDPRLGVATLDLFFGLDQARHV
jgi:hypothetical protein